LPHAPRPAVASSHARTAAIICAATCAAICASRRYRSGAQNRLICVRKAAVVPGAGWLLRAEQAWACRDATGRQVRGDDEQQVLRSPLLMNVESPLLV
jgi:hypothetical protein